MNQKECCHIEEKKSSLIPLYILLGGIVGVSLILTYFFQSNTFMMYIMGIWFLAFGLLKFYDLHGFVEAFSEYDLIAKKWKSWGYIFPCIEIVLGLIYIFNTSMIFMTEVNIIALLISLLGMISAYFVVKSGENIACACMGTKWKLPMTKVTIIENLVMAIMALLMLIFPLQSMMFNPFSNIRDEVTIENSLDDGTFQWETNDDTIMSSEMVIPTPGIDAEKAMRDHCQMMPEMAGCEKYR